MLCHSTCYNFGTDYKNLITIIEKLNAWPNFATEVEDINTQQRRLQTFTIFYILRRQSTISDFLDRISNLIIQTTLNLSNIIAI